VWNGYKYIAINYLSKLLHYIYFFIISNGKKTKNKTFEKIKENLFLLFARIKHERFLSMFTFVANHYGVAFNGQHIKAFIDRILSDDSHIADRYDRTRVLTILMEELNKLPKR
jgi:hypothetical protein